MINRLFILTCDPKGQDEFNRVGENNLLVSIEKEEGTLAMYAAHDPQNPSVNYVFEVYKDEDAYQIHAHAEQFLAFGGVAKNYLTDRKVITLNPQFFTEKKEQLKISGENDISVRLAYVKVKADKMDDFKASVTKNMRTSVEKEDGILAMYGSTVADSPQEWYFWELYQNEDAYQAHRETDHFKTYIAETADCLEDKKLLPLKGDTLVNKPAFVK